jgi:serine/threonine-protein kinase RsbW
MSLKKIGELAIRSNPSCLSKVDRFAEKKLRRLHMSRSDQDDVAIALSEAVNNAILHGNNQDSSKNVLICLYKCAKYLRVTVQDEGHGFSPVNVPDPREEENLLKASGRGILIMRHLMDRVAFKSYKAGMKVIMDKFCPEGC